MNSSESHPSDERIADLESQLEALRTDHAVLQAKLNRRKDLDEVVSIFQAVVQHFPEPLLVFDRNSQILHASPQATALLAEHQPENSTSLPLALDDLLETAFREDRSFLPRDTRGVIEVRTASSRKRSYLRRLQLLTDADGKQLGAVVTLQDVTEFRMLSQIKADLIGTVSHELKNPIAAISMGLSMVLDGTLGEISESQLEVLQAAARELDRIDETTCLLRDLNRFQPDEQSLKKRPELVEKLIQDTLSIHQYELQRKLVEVRYSLCQNCPEIICDGARIMTALDHLLIGLLQFCKKGGELTLRTEADQERLTIKISDEEGGIPIGLHGKIFAKGCRPPAELGTSGLGLRIAQQFIEAHRGQIGIDPLPNGSTIWLTLPIEEAGDLS